MHTSPSSLPSATSPTLASLEEPKKALLSPVSQTSPNKLTSTLSKTIPILPTQKSLVERVTPTNSTNGNRYRVSTTLDSGKPYRRIGGAEAITLEEGICGNIRPVYATAPESCFNFNSSLGAIQGYCIHQNNNPANPACPIDFTTPATIGGVGVREINNNIGPYNHGIHNVVLAEGVTAITGNGFSVASSLQSIYIPSTMTNIEGGGFCGTKLVSAYVPASVSSFTGCGFGGITTLKSLSIGMDSTEGSAPLDFGNYCGIIPSTGHLNYLGIGSNVTGLCSAGQNISGHVVFQDGEKELTLGSSSFSDATLDSLTLPNRLKEIANTSFSGAKIKRLTIKEGTVPLTIHMGSFSGCSQLEFISFPARTQTVSGGAFYDCSSLTNVTFQTGIQVDRRRGLYQYEYNTGVCSDIHYGHAICIQLRHCHCAPLTP